MRSKKGIQLEDLFGGLQKQMESLLSTNREIIQHPGSKGDAIENVWIEWLRTYLPNRYNVNKAIIIDSEGNLSDQIDLVIYDQQYTPFVFNQNGFQYIPAEGVYAVFEVKPDLKGAVRVGEESISYIEYAGRKIESVRRLKRTSTKIIDRGIQKPARPLTKIIGGILTSENSFVHSSTIEKHLSKLVELETIDMGCSVNYGSFYIDYNGNETSNETDLNKRIKDYYKTRILKNVKFENKDKALVSFFLQLSRYLQQSIGTVAAIDFNAYANTMGFEIDTEL